MGIKRERIEMVGNHDIHWDSDMETVLHECVAVLTELFCGTSYSAVRNTTVGEKCIDVFWGQERVNNPRIAHIWPKLRAEKVDLCLQTVFVDRIKDVINLPEDSDVKDGRYPNWRTFKKIPVTKAVEILGAVAGKN